MLGAMAEKFHTQKKETVLGDVLYGLNPEHFLRFHKFAVIKCSTNAYK